MFVLHSCHVNVLVQLFFFLKIKNATENNSHKWPHTVAESPKHLQPSFVFVTVSGCKVSLACRWGSDAVFQSEGPLLEARARREGDEEKRERMLQQAPNRSIRPLNAYHRIRH